MNKDAKSLYIMYRCPLPISVSHGRSLNYVLYTNYYDNISLKISTLQIVPKILFLLNANYKAGYKQFEYVPNLLLLLLLLLILKFSVIQHSFRQNCPVQSHDNIEQ